MSKRSTGKATRRVVGVAGSILAAVLTLGCADETHGSQGGTELTEGFRDFRTSDPQVLTREHRSGRLSYPMSPPVGGDHNPVWQNCNGDVYDAPVNPEHAVHSLEHGAVWITYRPGLPADQVDALAGRVRDRSYLFMSPYPGLDVAVSVQAWGYQLKVGSATDARIDDFIRTYRITASLEPGAPCSGGVTSPS